MRAKEIHPSSRIAIKAPTNGLPDSSLLRHPFLSSRPSLKASMRKCKIEERFLASTTGYEEIVSQCNEHPFTLFTTLSKAIESNDAALIFFLKKECIQWNHLSPNQLTSLGDAFIWKLNQSCEIMEDSATTEIFMMLFVDHPKSDISVKHLGKWLKWIGMAGASPLFLRLKNDHPAWDHLTQDQLTEIADLTARCLNNQACHQSEKAKQLLIEWKRSIFAELASHPQWDSLSAKNMTQYANLLCLSEIFNADELKELFISLSSLPNWEKLSDRQVVEIINNALENVTPEFSLPVVQALLQHPSLNSTDLFLVNRYGSILHKVIHRLANNGPGSDTKLKEFIAIIQHPLWHQLKPASLSAIVGVPRIPDEVVAIIAQHKEWPNLTFSELKELIAPGHFPILNSSPLNIDLLTTHPSWGKATKAQLLKIAMGAARSTNDPLAPILLEKIASHPAWREISPQDIVSLLKNMHAKPSYVERNIVQILVQHPLWTTISEEALTQALSPECVKWIREIGKI